MTDSDSENPQRQEKSIIPKKIGSYKIECLLDKGGMSLLYLGTHPSINDPVAIKVLSPKFLSNPDIVQRFLNESEIISMTNHPNIVKQYGHGEWEGGLYIAMEFIEGISLRQYILQNPISLNMALKMIIDIAYALCHLHTHGVIHRDLKPENILVTERGEIKVIDFGIAQLLTEKQAQDHPPKQRLIGTPVYMSPEQKENPEMVSFPSDIYSLGIIAYELILGKLSYGKVHLSLMPRGIQKILHKALQPNVVNRYQDIVDFISDVAEYLHSTEIEKEKNAANYFGEISESLRYVQSRLVPETPPDWKGLDIGIGRYQGANLSGVYYDFFPVNEHDYGIIMSECSVRGAKSIVYMGVFRGMVRALCKMTPHPIEMVSILNNLLLQDKMEPAFTLSYLILKPDSKQYSFISCGYGSLWHVTQDAEFPKCITTNNLALGMNFQDFFHEEAGSWKEGDLLVLNTFSLIIGHEEKRTTSFNDEIFGQLLTDNKNLSAQQVINNILKKFRTLMPQKILDRPITLIGIKIPKKDKNC